MPPFVSCVAADFCGNYKLAAKKILTSRTIGLHKVQKKYYISNYLHQSSPNLFFLDFTTFEDISEGMKTYCVCRKLYKRKIFIIRINSLILRK